MTLKEAYEYMFAILDSYWKRKPDSELGSVLGGLNPRNPWMSKEGMPADPAAWQDWVEAVRKVTSNDSVSEGEAFRAMIELLKEYNAHHGFDLTDVIRHFELEAA